MTLLKDRPKKKGKQNPSSVTALNILIGLLFVVAVGVIGFVLYQVQNRSSTPSSAPLVIATQPAIPTSSEPTATWSAFVVVTKVPPTAAPVIHYADSSSSDVGYSSSGGVSCPSLSARCSSLTCDQAYACLAAGNGVIDGDNDGKPCENQCGH